jgi:hypothetical protein
MSVQLPQKRAIRYSSAPACCALVRKWSAPVFSTHGDEPGGIEDKLGDYCA